MTWGSWLWVDTRDGKRWDVTMRPLDVVSDRWLLVFEAKEALNVLTVEFTSHGGKPTDLQTQALLDRARTGDR